MNKKKFLQKYFKETQNIFEQIKLDDEKIIRSSNLFKKIAKKKNKIIIAGNGGSAAIASHFAVDLSKNAGLRAVNFNDADLITCLSNDYGYEKWIESALKLYADKNDLVILVSSSGTSKNHIIAAKYLIKKKISLVTLTGKSKNNPLKKINKNGINFWINSNSYNLIEIFHLYILLSIVDLCIGKSEYSPSKKIKI